MNNALSKTVICLALILFGVLSFFPLAARFSAPERYTQYMDSIDAKTETVLKLMAASTVTSAGLSAMPGDAGTPIADKLADFSEYFLLILCVLYAEKYLVGIIGAGVFKVLIPCACALGVLSLFRYPQLFRRLAIKLAAVGVALYLIIPISFKVSDLIYGAYRESIDGTISAAETLSDETAPLADAAEDKGLVQSILDRLKETTSSLTDKAVDAVNRFVETLAVMIVTSCVIPVLVLLFFLWVIKQLTGVDLSASLPRPRAGRMRRKPESKPEA